MNPKKVMILEDDEATAELIRFYLEEDDFQTSVLLEGKDFVDKAAAYQPGLITIDVILPDTDGFSVFEALKRDKRTKDIPVIFVTVSEEVQEKGIKMGAHGYLSKPFKEDDFKKVINSIPWKET